MPKLNAVIKDSPADHNWHNNILIPAVNEVYELIPNTYTEAGWKVIRIGLFYVFAARINATITSTADYTLVLPRKARATNSYHVVLLPYQSLTSGVIPTVYSPTLDNVKLSFRSLNGTRLEGTQTIDVFIIGEFE